MNFTSQIWQTCNLLGTIFANLAWYRRIKDLVPLLDPKVTLFENSNKDSAPAAFAFIFLHIHLFLYIYFPSISIYSVARVFYIFNCPFIFTYSVARLFLHSQLPVYFTYSIARLFLHIHLPVYFYIFISPSISTYSIAHKFSIYFFSLLYLHIQLPVCIWWDEGVCGLCPVRPLLGVQERTIKKVCRGINGTKPKNKMLLML